MNALIWDLMFPTESLGQSPSVNCDPRWLDFLLCCVERVKNKTTVQDYFKLNQLTNLKRTVDTVDTELNRNSRQQ